MQQAPPSYSQTRFNNSTESLDSPPTYSLNLDDITLPWKKESEDVESQSNVSSDPFPNSPKSMCWSFLITFILILFVLPLLGLLLFLCKNVLNYDPNQIAM
ncbi:unnamed protein product [Caenorhabditis angaria]|uniref:Uncharacterized protein n=1 Tax=Caenorhabditis angaria TaxID=860376 RepID=A0A9P1IBW9_9PELO|nr:unnamed protein product [Caenorhabditis angaria]